MLLNLAGAKSNFLILSGVSLRRAFPMQNTLRGLDIQKDTSSQIP